MALSGARARRNRLEQSIVYGPTAGDGVAVDDGAGQPDDGTGDNVIVEGTDGADSITVAGSSGSASVAGLAATVNVTGAEPASDRLIINARGGDDVRRRVGGALVAGLVDDQHRVERRAPRARDQPARGERDERRGVRLARLEIDVDQDRRHVRSS